MIGKKIGNAISTVFHKNPITISIDHKFIWVIKMLQIFWKIQKLKKEIEDLKMNKHEADLIRSEKSFSLKIMFKDLMKN